MKFYGYRRADGSVGCRNLVAVIPSVVCAADVAQAIVQNVQGAVGLFHHQGWQPASAGFKKSDGYADWTGVKSQCRSGFDCQPWLRGNRSCENVPGNSGGRQAGGDYWNPEAWRC